MDRKSLWHLLYWSVAMLLLLGLQHWLAGGQTQRVSFSEFEQALQQQRLQEVVVTDTHLSGRLKTPEQGRTELVAVRVAPELAAWLDRYGVPYRAVLQSSLLRDVLSWILLSLVFFGLWWWLIRKLVQRQGMGGLMQIGQSRAKVHVTQDTGVSFADVAGGRSQAGNAGGGGFSQAPRGLRTAGRTHPQGRAAGGAARHRQDPAGQGGGG